MKIVRHIAPDMRQAMRSIREQLGEDAVILSSRKIPEGVEVTAAVDFDDPPAEGESDPCSRGFLVVVETLEHGKDPLGVLGLVHHPHQVGVGEEVAQLLGDIAVVHVDGDSADLVGRQRGLHILEAVGQIEADVLIRSHALFDEPVGQPVGALLELGIGALGATTAQGDAIGHLVGYCFPQVGQVERAGGRGRRHGSLMLCGDWAGLLSSGPIGALVTGKATVITESKGYSRTTTSGTSTTKGTSST